MNEALMDRLVSECDMIYHLASAVNVRVIVNRTVEVIERRVSGSEVVLKTANRYKRKVLITSTSEVYDKINKVPFNEDDDRILGPTTKSHWDYSCSKTIDEFWTLAYYLTARATERTGAARPENRRNLFFAGISNVTV